MPIAAIWAVLSKLPWRYIGAALAALGLVITIYKAPWAYNRGYHARDAEVARYRQANDVLTASLRVATDAIDRQNAAVSALKASGDKRMADGKAALAAAQRANAGLSAQAADLRKSAGRKVDNTPCPISDTLAKAGAI